MTYNASGYHIPHETLRRLSEKSLWLVPSYVLLNWLLAAGIITFFLQFGNIYLFPLAVLLIAGRQGAFLNVVHELAHSGWRVHPRLISFVGQWFCAYPIGVHFEGFRSAHLMHHQYTNREQDPASDKEKYRVADPKNPELFRLFLKDLLGITALQVFFSYAGGNEATTRTAANRLKGFAGKLVGMGLPNFLVLFFLFQGSLPLYLALWLFPAMSVHMVLMRIRGIAEHGLGVQLEVPDLTTKSGVGTFYTRSILTSSNGVWGLIERFLIGSVGVNMHHEHHLFPSVPFNKLGKLHRLIRSEVVKRNPKVYVPGYWDAVVNPIGSTKKVSFSENA